MAVALFDLAQKPVGEVLPRLRRGLPAAALDQMAATLGISKGVLADKLRIARRTLSRKQSGRIPLSAEESEKVLRLARVRNLAQALFRSDEAISRWLETPDASLGNCAPLDLLDTDVGAREVENLIRAVGHGQFV